MHNLKLIVSVSAIMLVTFTICGCRVKMPQKYTSEKSTDAKMASENRMALVECLNRKKIRLYTAEWCGPCRIQKSYFGPEYSQFKGVIECDHDSSDDPEGYPCKGITHIPTWTEPDGTYLGGLMTLERLAEKTGCSYE